MFGCKKLILISCVTVVSLLDAENKLIHYDGIKVAICGVQQNDIITYSELRRPGIDGSVRSIDTLINQYLEAQDALHYGMKATPEMVDKQLQTIFRNNNMHEEDFHKMLKAAGWLPEEGREEFGRITDVNQIEHFKVYSQLIVPEREIVDYYQKNPEIISASYYVQRAVIPYDFEMTKEEQENELEKNKKLDWQEPFWINAHDLADDRSFIHALGVGHISLAHQASDGFEFFKMIDRKEQHEKSLDERRPEIIERLRRPKAEKLLTEYRQELRNLAQIIFFDENQD